MKKRHLLIIVLVLFILSTLYLAYSLCKLKNDGKINTETLKTENHLLDSKYNTVVKCLAKQINIQNNDFVIGQCLNYDGEIKDISELDGKNKFIFYAGSQYCGSCIDWHLEKLTDNIKQIGSDNIIIVFNKLKDRDFAYFMNNNPKLSNINILCSINDISDIIPDEITPLLFVLDKNMKISNAFIPLKNEPYISDTYYSAVRKKYF